MNLKYIGILTFFAYLSVVLAQGLYLFGHMALKTEPSVLAHIILSLFAMSLLLLASLQAILMGLQNYLLKHHRPSSMLRILPPLQAMETVLFHLIWCGMLFFSGAFISGICSEGLSSALLPKMILALCAWILLTLLLLGRYRFGWRGPTAIRWTLTSTSFALLSYFGTKALLL